MGLLNRVAHALRDVGKPKRSSHWPVAERAWLEKNPCCLACNSRTRVQVHHKKPFHLFPELELDESNFITLCMGKNECHLLLGHGGSFFKWVPEVEELAREMRGSFNLGAWDKVIAKAREFRQPR